MAWLQEGGEESLAKIVESHELSIRDRKGNDNSPFQGVITRQDGVWGLTVGGKTTTITWLAAFLSEVPVDNWLDLTIERDFERTAAIERGTKIATDIGKIFTSLLPAYGAAAGIDTGR
jgi:signal recognition particle GTPase